VYCDHDCDCDGVCDFTAVLLSEAVPAGRTGADGSRQSWEPDGGEAVRDGRGGRQLQG
jgi:hypothetical protein